MKTTGIYMWIYDKPRAFHTLSDLLLKNPCEVCKVGLIFYYPHFI